MVDPNTHSLEDWSWQDVGKWLKRWGFHIIGLITLIIVIIFVSRSVMSSQPKLCSNETIRLTFYNISTCELSKPISSLEVTNDISIKGCFIESLIKILPDSCGSSDTNSGKLDQGYFGTKSDEKFNDMGRINPPTCNCGLRSPDQKISSPGDNRNPSSIPSISNPSVPHSSITDHNSTDYASDASIINGIHGSLLQRRILSGKWNDSICKSDIPDMYKNRADVLENASYISIKFIVFGNDTTPCIKASYTSTNISYQLHELQTDSLMTFSKFWRFKKSTACFVTQQSEIVVIPMKKEKHCGKTRKVQFHSNHFLSHCRQTTKQVLINKSLNQQMPNIITSILLCH